MKRCAAGVLSLMLVVAVTAPLAASEKKHSSLLKSVLKKFEAAKLTEEQVAKIKQLVEKVAEKTASARKQAVYTPEQMKARRDALVKAKAEGKKGKDLIAAMNAAATFTSTQEAAVRQLHKAYSDMMKEIVRMLSDEQKARLPRKSKSKS